ncbi:HpcH/HpaI aldolase family protein [Falsiroseomonas oryzae]|uniref:HpcH/HpaI aldolase family protein n=1 Tax=Falsiroseomonas oryzae TaxID=2766473 RepID=UPI0022EA5542|nr:aldolase/citrate lyase family protein [Roseomonas sp. MO-31]
MTASAPVVVNRVREKLARDEVVASMTARLVRGIEVAQIAASTGFDSLYVDLEHGPLTIDVTGQICMAALALGVTPFVRVPALTPEFVGRVLDAGALGIIAPHVHGAEDARALVRMARFPPLGTRSAAGHLPQFGFRAWPAKVGDPVLDAATMVIPMIETVEALRNAEEILAVPGVDMVLVGTNDLTAELGIPGEFDHPEVRAAYARLIQVARGCGKHVGIGGLATRPDLTAEFVRMGARYVSTGTDLGFLIGACAAKAREVHAMPT